MNRGKESVGGRLLFEFSTWYSAFGTSADQWLDCHWLYC